MKTRHFSCPGSLLLAGEYLVTEQRGPGIAIAVSPRAHLASVPAGRDSAECRFALETQLWDEGAEQELSLPAIIHSRLGPENNREHRQLTVDTTAFYHSDGRKAGYGSSAAGTVLLTAGWSQSDNRELLGQLALECHREFQGGRGSGYDVLCSLHGGVGLFIGGTIPEWKPLDWPTGLKGWILPGEKPVSSSNAVSRYNDWKTREPGQYRDYREKGEELTAEIMPGLMSPSAPMLTEGLNRLGSHARQLGDKIGVPANPTLPGRLEALSAPRSGIAVKCLGAGDELILILACDDALVPAEENFLSGLIARGEAADLRPDFRGLKEEIR